MTNPIQFAIRRARAATAALVGVLLLLPVIAGPLHAWSEFGERQDETSRPERAVKEPLFELLLELADVDSLGRWSGEQVRERALAGGRESNFPLDLITALTRSRPDSALGRGYADAAVRAVWTIDLRDDQEFALPYSILGYHPGSLRLARRLVLAELAATDVHLAVREDGVRRVVTVRSARIFALEQGHLVLDADGLVDKLLGSLLDDSWTLGFVTGRLFDPTAPDGPTPAAGTLLGVGVFLGRDGRHIFGEFDFALDKIRPHGRPAAAALSRHSRTWLDPARGRLPQPWAVR